MAHEFLIFFKWYMSPNLGFLIQYFITELLVKIGQLMALLNQKNIMYLYEQCLLVLYCIVHSVFETYEINSLFLNKNLILTEWTDCIWLISSYSIVNALCTVILLPHFVTHLHLGLCLILGKDLSYLNLLVIYIYQVKQNLLVR